MKHISLTRSEELLEKRVNFDFDSEGKRFYWLHHYLSVDLLQHDFSQV